MGSLADSPQAAAKFVGCEYPSTISHYNAIPTSDIQCTRRSKRREVQWLGELMHCIVSSRSFCRGKKRLTLPLPDRPITQLKINWVLFGSALVIALPTVLAITPSPVHNSEAEDSGPEEEGPQKRPHHSS